MAKPRQLLLLNLHEFEFNRSRPAKDADHYAKLAFLGLDVFHDSGEVEEWPIGNPDSFANFEKDLWPGFSAPSSIRRVIFEDSLIRDRERVIAPRRIR